MASIDFTDGTGAATLESDYPTPGDRFANWLPDVRPIGPSLTKLSTGVTERWVFRTDYLASFAIQGIKAARLDIAIRLKLHLMNGGVATLNTDDLATRVYVVRMAPETEPTITGPDDLGEYTFAMVAFGASAPMRVTYTAPSS